MHYYNNLNFEILRKIKQTLRFYQLVNVFYHKPQYNHRTLH